MASLQPNFVPVERRTDGLEDGTQRPNLPRPWTPKELDELRKYGHPRSSVQRVQPGAEKKESYAQELSYRAGIPLHAALMLEATFAALEARVALLESLLHAETGKTLGDLVTRDH